MSDVLATLDRLRPDPVQLDPAWSEQTLAAILAAPESTADVRPRRRRTTKLVTGVAAFAALGVGAAAAGVTPQSFVDAFAGWSFVGPEHDPGAQSVDAATAQRVVTAPGPGGTVFSLVEARGRGDYACVAVLFETRASASGSDPTDFVDANGSACSSALSPVVGFGTMMATDVQRLPAELGEDEVVVYSVSAGDAVRAEVRGPDGELSAPLFHEGRFYGWYAGEPFDHVLIGFAADGSEVGRVAP